MRLRLDPQSGVPLYLQVAQGIRGLLASGLLPHGTELPSVRTLGAELRVNYHTVARAYRLLQEEGALERRRGGPFVVRRGQVAHTARGLIAEDAMHLARKSRSLGLDDATVRALLDDAFRELGPPPEGDDDERDSPVAAGPRPDAG
jgi:GntR family transcriptional regulator